MYSREKLSSYIEFTDNRTLVLVARIIRKSVDEIIKKATQLLWSPSVDELESRSTEPLAELTDFLSKLLIDNSHHSVGSTKSRVVRSIADDIIYNVSSGGFAWVGSWARNI